MALSLYIGSIWRAWLHAYYSGKLAEVKENRLYLVAQSNETHRMLDDRQRDLSAKIMELEMRK